MRIYISADLEGIGGVVSGHQTNHTDKEHERARRLMTAEVNSVIRGALRGGATEITVNDSHGSMRNLLIEELSPPASLITGSPKPLSMMQGIGPEYHAVFLVGYHAQAGTLDGILDHTFSGSVHRVMVNDIQIGETGLNAILAAQFGVPVRLVTGDKAVTEEARRLLGPGVQVVAVKEAYGRTAAECLPLERIHEELGAAATRALSETATPLALDPPFRLTVEFARSSQADLAALIPGSSRQDARRLAFSHDDYTVLYRAFRAMVALASLGDK